METLQLAQMLADLSAMEAAEKEASMSLVSANKSISQTSAGSDSALTSDARLGVGSRTGSQHQRSISSGHVPQPGSPPSSQQHLPGTRLDALGRRMPISRTESASNSLPGTPRNESHDDEINRARNIMALSEIRAKLREQDHTSLLRARDKMNALAARQQQQQQLQRPKAQRTQSNSVFVFPRDK
ncbi:uncharacterized protein MKZ38_008787 [Zalerion maritima]|uniref:Uncharacterized protein n=1 Tax=Zalerion maritima TaxID=339359 RepID=A0AAD5WVG9_9PEZI|nr:uncharacterized protein MKZ38_008787 [Zalerion maritima]